MKSHKFNFTEENRNLPLQVKLSVMFLNPFAIIGIIFFLAGGVFFAFFVSFSDFKSLKYSDDDPIVRGVITEIEKTSSSSNKKTIYAYHFKYNNLEGKTYNGISYKEGKVKQINDTVSVQYCKNEPETARIEGMRNNNFEWWVSIFTAIFPLIGLIFLFASILKGINNIKILTKGVLTTGKFIDKTPTNTRINKRTVYKMYFEFTANDRQKYKISVNTHEPEKLEDESEEMLVYLPDNPQKAALIDSLPKIVRKYINEN